MSGDLALRTREARHSAWVHGPIADVVLGWSWLPVAVALHAVQSSIETTQALMLGVFVLSFAHQPLTLGLVYGDRRQRDAHRRLYAWAPLVALVAILIGLSVSLTIVALVAGLWNAEHTMMQRYGVLRIYGRKAGDDHGRLEKAILVAWLAAAMLFLAAFVDLESIAYRLGADRTNMRGVELLESVSTVATIGFWLAAAASALLVGRWVRAERRRPPSPSRRAKVLYAASTLGLVVAVLVDPLAGIGGYIAAHAIEYFAIVDGSLRRRAKARDREPVVRVAATRVRRAATYATYGAAMLGLVAVLYERLDGRLYGFAILFFGALHILYDGFVWKLRQPAVAASLGITAVPAEAG